jgi:hypothetical protein
MARSSIEFSAQSQIAGARGARTTQFSERCGFFFFAFAVFFFCFSASWLQAGYQLASSRLVDATSSRRFGRGLRRLILQFGHIFSHLLDQLSFIKRAPFMSVGH